MGELRRDYHVLTAREIEALNIAQQPRAARGAIYEALGVSPQTVHNRIARARQKLAQARAARLAA